MRIILHGGGTARVLEVADLQILFSYADPVAFHVKGRGYTRTDRVLSKTTLAHVDTWTSNHATVVPDSQFVAQLAAALGLAAADARFTL